MTKTILPENGAKLSLLTEYQKAFIKAGERKNSRIDWYSESEGFCKENSLPATVTLTWETDEKHSCLMLSESESFENPLIVETDEKAFTVENLFAGRKYFWSVNDSAVSSFETEEGAPRFIHIEGMKNVRDLGGWKLQNGKKIKQGLLYRGCAFDDTKDFAEWNGRKVLFEGLKLRSDLDLRGESLEAGLTASTAGSELNYICAPSYAYRHFIGEDKPQSTKKIFEALADESNYPIYFHCAGGADRTGTLAFLIEGMLGVNESDMILDYELTTISMYTIRDHRWDIFKEMLQLLNLFGTPEMTINQKVINYLRAYGVTDEMMNRIRAILTED